MTVPSRLNLKEYFQAVLELEKEIVVLEKAVEGISKRISSFEVQKQNAISIMHESQSILDSWNSVWARNKAILAHDEGIGFEIFKVTAPIFIIGNIVLDIIFFPKYLSEDGYINVNLIFSVICVGIAILVRVCFAIRSTKDFNEVVQYHRARVDSGRQTSHWLQPMIDISRRDVANIGVTLNNTKILLAQLYSLDIIYHKYRNIVAVASILEYLESGSCTTLEGHEGAYYKFDGEYILNKIRDDLNMIMVNQELMLNELKEIKRVNYMLYSALNETNSNIARLTGAVNNMNDAMASHQEAIEFNTRCTANATRTLASYTFWRDLYRSL